LSYEVHNVYLKFGWYYLLQDKFSFMLGHIQRPHIISLPRNNWACIAQNCRHSIFLTLQLFPRREDLAQLKYWEPCKEHGTLIRHCVKGFIDPFVSQTGKWCERLQAIVCVCMLMVMEKNRVIFSEPALWATYQWYYTIHTLTIFIVFISKNKSD